MTKRVTFLKKRTDVSQEYFHEHWLDPHGPIAARFSGLVRYHQNHVTERLLSTAERRYFLDGIVELWFEDAVGTSPGRDRDVTAELVVDEPFFLSGLTGYPVMAADPADASPWTVWVLGRWGDDQPGSCDVEIAFAPLLRLVPAIVRAEFNLPEPGSPQFTRDALSVDSEPPQVAIALRFGGRHPSAADRDRILTWLSSSLPAGLTDVECVLAEEIRIV